jgi:hypothetical protein
VLTQMLLEHHRAAVEYFSGDGTPLVELGMMD